MLWALLPHFGEDGRVRRSLFVLMVALGACSSGASPAGTTEPIERAEALPLQIAFQGLCDAQVRAEAGDTWGASDFFQDRAHGYLHEFASRISVSDREGAARLLEAKQVVEALLATPDTADPEAVAAALQRLQDTLAGAAVTAGFEQPTCGGSGA